MGERIGLVITQDDVYRTERNLLRTTNVLSKESMLSYINAVHERIRVNQPNLLNYYRDLPKYFNIKNTYVVAYAAALTFEMIPDEVSCNSLSKDDLDLFHRHFFDYAYGDGGFQDAFANLAKWPNSEFKTDVAPYLNWVKKLVSGFEDEEDKYDFYLGSFITSLAFHFKSMQD